MSETTHRSVSIASLASRFADLVKFEHTIFALPFAMAAMVLAAGTLWPSWQTACWVLLAMVGGRTYAMALNRLIDAEIDAKNPRTSMRAIPAGRVRRKEAWVLVLFSALVLTLATFQLPWICRGLLPVAFFILTLYSYVKRFSSLAHLVLGVALGSSAVGGWLAVTGEITWLPVLFGFAVVFWVAGFDIIYATQDVGFDREAGLYSIPAAMGIPKALQLSRVFHGLTILLLTTFGLMYSYTGIFYWIAVGIVAAMLIYEHWIVHSDSPADGGIRLDKVNEAFFNINGRISMAVFLLVVLDKLF
jgi:4-hydroxybenzoate polyprenyltransferase